MSEFSEPVVTEEKTAAPQGSHARILWIMSGVLICGIVLSLIYAAREFTFGLIIGGGLAFVNYYWLRQTLRNLFDRMTSAGEKPQFLAARYFLRYAALGAVLMIVYVTQVVSVVAVLLGLCAFAFAVVVEGLIKIFTTQNSNKEEL